MNRVDGVVGLRAMVRREKVNEDGGERLETLAVNREPEGARTHLPDPRAKTGSGRMYGRASWAVALLLQLSFSSHFDHHSRPRHSYRDQYR